MKKIEIKISDIGKIEVVFIEGVFTHKNIRDIKRAIDVAFRSFHYNLLHSSKDGATTKIGV